MATLNFDRAVVRASERELAERVQELCSLLRSNVRMNDQTRREYIATVDRLNSRRAELRKTLEWRE